MSKDKKHIDELEEFYRSAFDSAEMDVPSALTDSLIDKLQEKNVSTVDKKSLSERIGASKLYRYLQVSLVFNLITVATLGVYLLNNDQETIKIETPINPVIIEESQAQKVHQDASEKNSLNDVVPSNKKPKNETHLPIQKPTTEHSDELRKTKEVEEQPIVDSVISNNEIEDLVDEEIISIDSIEEEVIDVPKVEGGPVDLDELRDRFKDTVKGKPLFK